VRAVVIERRVDYVVFVSPWDGCPELNEAVLRQGLKDRERCGRICEQTPNINGDATVLTGRLERRARGADDRALSLVHVRAVSNPPEQGILVLDLS
jgi:hypothetical protein